MIEYGPSTALLVVDVQNDFADPAGGLSVPGGAEVVPAVNREIERARVSGATVIFSQDWHPESTPHFARDGGIWPVHCVAGSWGAALHPDVAVAQDDRRIRKGVNGEDGYSAFTMRDPVTGDTVPTGLEALLRDAAVSRVVVVGLATDYCVKATGLDAVRLGFDTTLVADATAAVDLEPGDGERAVDEMRAAGIHVAAATDTGT
ncbi:MAG TPA: isochorismatase family protein [Vitreimonas sp.]|nr:isochorismatase family protein [Vitreimonas sp.]